MKKLLIALLVLPFFAFSQQAEERIMTMTTIKVKQGHTQQFEDGVKKWKECYKESGGENGWNFWTRMQGESGVYGVTGFMDKWAEMDESDPAGKDCYAIVMNFIMPHVESTTNAMSRSLPAWSKQSAPSDMKLAWVTYFKTDDRDQFSDVIKEVTSTMKDVEGDSRGYWYRMIGGDRDDADYFVSTIYSSYAELDADRDSPWEMYVKVKGEKKAKEMDKMWDDAGVETWSYIWQYNEELSF